MTQKDKWDKRACVIKYREWCDGVRHILFEQQIVLPDPYDVEDLSWTAYLLPPVSRHTGYRFSKKTGKQVRTYKKMTKDERDALIGELHRVKPDRDNIDKAVLDCLFKEDSGIAQGTLRKEYSWEPRLEIVIK
jgi:hypothetical protein